MPARILVVADDATQQRLLSHAMHGEGHEVLLATSPQDGLRRWTADRPELIVLDASVAGGTGIGLVERIRGSEGTAGHVPIIMLGEADPQAKVRGLKAGADDYQTKPFHNVELAARTRRLLARFAPRPSSAAESTRRGRVHAYYGAKGGVGTTTVAINAGIAMHRVMHRQVVLVDANLQFGDHRVFLDMGPDRRSIFDAVTAPSIDSELLRNLVVHHHSGVDLLLAPPNPEAAEHVSSEQHHMAQIVETLRTLYDDVVVDVDKRLDDNSLDIIGAADRLFVVMTADLSCLKNVRLVLETLSSIGTPDHKVELLLNRSNAFTGISAKSVEGVLRRSVRYQIINDYRAAISALNSGEPFMNGRSDSLIGRSVLEFVRAIDAEPLPARPAPTQVLIPALT